MSGWRRSLGSPPAQLWRVTMPHGVAGLGMRHGVCALATKSLRWCIGKDAHTLRAQLEMLGYHVESVQPRKRS